jgi:putative Holliday junction resolvase
MGRILAIDYGRKRVGLAVTDELRMIATPLGTVHSAEVIGYLKKYLSDHEVDCFVVGEPRDMKNRPSESERFILPFIRMLKKEFPSAEVKRFDERFTSLMATQAIREAGLKKKDRRDKALVDTVSAVLILQSYLESLSMSR